MHSVFL